MVLSRREVTRRASGAGLEREDRQRVEEERKGRGKEWVERIVFSVFKSHVWRIRGEGRRDHARRRIGYFQTVSFAVCVCV